MHEDPDVRLDIEVGILEILRNKIDLFDSL